MKERLNSLMDFLRISASELARKTGLSSQYISNVLKRDGDMTNSYLASILNAYPTLNARWLLTGEGDMWESPEEKDYSTMKTHTISITKEGGVEYRTNMEGLKEQLRSQRETIEVQKKIIAMYEEKKEEKV
jgi:transcriptional regulator with XRE-family HTH domain